MVRLEYLIKCPWAMLALCLRQQSVRADKVAVEAPTPGLENSILLGADRVVDVWKIWRS